MSQETQWKTVADRQYAMGVQRAQEEQFYAQKIKQAYMNELSNQMKANDQIRKKKLYEEQLNEKKLIEDAIEKQKQIIELERARVRIKNERAERLDAENEVLQEMKRKQAEFAKKMDADMQTETIRATNRIEFQKRYEQAKRKQEFRKDMVDSIEYNKQYKTLSQKYEKQYAKKQLEQGQNRKIKDEIERVKFYNQLKERSKMVDYGSHRVFEDKHNKSLVEKKKQEWKIYKDSIQISEKNKQIQQSARMHKLLLENQYRQELQRQMEEKNFSHRHKAMSELQAEKRTIEYSQEMAGRAYYARKEQEEDQKKKLAQYLRIQASLKAKQKQSDAEMRAQEMKLNMQILSKEGGITSMDTYHLDPQRKRQLQILQSSIDPSRYTTDPAQNQKLPYFANRGRSLMS